MADFKSYRSTALRMLQMIGAQSQQMTDLLNKIENIRGCGDGGIPDWYAYTERALGNIGTALYMAGLRAEMPRG